ncbi:MAG: FkbM family methyltransferase [Minisyncoccia bacterium]
MRNSLSKILSKIGSLFNYVSNKVYISPFGDQKTLFRKDIGDSTNKLSFLDENSVVFDVGGYEGQWASNIYGKYNSNIHIFEPVPNFSVEIQHRFEKNKKIKVNKFGLSDKTETKKISVGGDGSSTIKKISEEKIDIKLVDVIEYIKQNNIRKIDLIKINIEGGEYALLNRLIDYGYMKNINYVLVQFHNFFPEAKKEMQEIKDKLKNSHNPVYQYEFIWELWKQN